ncbi:MAG: hypothetical protein QOE46_3332 [Acidobacteriota bacterium]|jgi:hypothetical protein|nr:hypothetical protein [Acidobacteriota bacterium]
MGIYKNLQKVHAAVVVDQVKGAGTLGEQIGVLAVNAIISGMDSDDWKKYMSLFADNAEQLNRLTVKAGSDDSWLRQARAYIVSNAVCAAGTTTFTGNRVTIDVDGDVSDAPDGTVVKPFNIGEV